MRLGKKENMKQNRREEKKDCLFVCLFVCLFACLFVCSLFNEEVSNSGYEISNGSMMVKNKLEGMWKKAVVDYLKVLSRNIRGLTEEKEGKAKVKENELGEESRRNRKGEIKKGKEEKNEENEN
jgi:hypothetical protein